MISFQIIGNDTAVSLASQAGQLELNVMTPVMISNILDSVSMLKNYLPVFQSQCIEDIQVDDERMVKIAGINPSLVTILSPKIGYLQAAELAHEAMETNQSIRELAVKKGIVSFEEAEKLFDLKIISKNQYNK
jgi:aspartate ammonia-lyase